MSGRRGARRGASRPGGRRGRCGGRGRRDADASDSSESEGDVDCRPQKVSANVYKDNSCSEGGKMKEQGTVLQSCRKLKRPKNMNCRVDSFGSLISKFDVDKRDIVKEMGFACLYSLVDKQLPQNLCYWLATRVDVVSKSLDTTDGRVVRLDPVQVHWVLGIPRGSNPVPKNVSDDEAMQSVMDRVRSKFARTTPSLVKGIPRKALVDALEGPLEDKEDFKIAFLLLAIVDILCPTTNHRLCSRFLPAAVAAQDAPSYDWCSFVIDHLFHAIESFARRFYPNGYAKGCGGCMIFLAILYMDRLKRPPVKWGVLPRLRVWTKEEINKAKKEDRHEGGDYGKLGTVMARYGREHEMSCEDIMPMKRPASEVVQAVQVVQAMLQGGYDYQEIDDELIATKSLKKRRTEYFKRKQMPITEGNVGTISVSDYMLDSPIMGEINDNPDIERRRMEVERELQMELERERGSEKYMLLEIELRFEYEIEMELLSDFENEYEKGYQLEYELELEFLRDCQEVLEYQQWLDVMLELEVQKLVLELSKKPKSPERVEDNFMYSSSEEDDEVGAPATHKGDRSRMRRKTLDSPGAD